MHRQLNDFVRWGRPGGVPCTDEHQSHALIMKRRVQVARGVSRHLGMRKHLDEDWLWEREQLFVLTRVTWAESGWRKGSEWQGRQLGAGLCRGATGVTLERDIGPALGGPSRKGWGSGYLAVSGKFSCLKVCFPCLQLCAP